MQKIMLYDDLENTPIKEGAGGTFKFGLDGQEYEIDLKQKNGDRLLSEFRPYIEAGRRISGSPAKPAPKASNRKAASASTAAIRAWADSQGIVLAPRGRISGKVIAQYDAAH